MHTREQEIVVLKSRPALDHGLPHPPVSSPAGTIPCHCQRLAEKALNSGVPSPDGNESVGSMLRGSIARWGLA